MAPAQSGPSSKADGDPELIAAQGWVGRALILRGFPAGDDLKYTARGELVGPAKVTDWTLAGFELQTVTRRTTGDLQLDGLRVAIRYNSDQHVFERHPQKQGAMRLVLASPAAGKLDAALGAMFSVGIDPALQRSMPAYWRHYFIPSEEWPADGLTGQTIFGAGGKAPEGANYPVAEKKPEPGYTPEAIQDHVHGSVQVRVDVDASGTPQRVVIRQPLGYGLDAKTVAAVERYRFQPGVLEGSPVAVEVTVNQSFE
jgi:TonB family protein